MNNVRNSCRFIGRLGRDPEMRYTPSGTALTKFGIAVNQRVPDGEGNWTRSTLWVDFTVWGKSAELAQRLLNKGTLVAVEAEYRKRPYTTDGGEKRIFHEFVANSFEILASADGGGDESVEDDGETGEDVEPGDSDFPF